MGRPQKEKRLVKQFAMNNPAGGDQTLSQAGYVAVNFDAPDWRIAP
jgi:hypothetical protein